jgi:hypothetical protein
MSISRKLTQTAPAHLSSNLSSLRFFPTSCLVILTQNVETSFPKKEWSFGVANAFPRLQYLTRITNSMLIPFTPRMSIKSWHRFSHAPSSQFSLQPNEQHYLFIFISGIVHNVYPFNFARDRLVRPHDCISQPYLPAVSPSAPRFDPQTEDACQVRASLASNRQAK